MKNIGIFCFLMMFCLQFSYAQIDGSKGIASLEKVKETNEKVMTMFTQNMIVEGYNILRTIWIIDESEIDHMQGLTIKYFNMLESQYGETIGFIQTSEEIVQDVAYKVNYVLKFEYHLLKFTFYYYQGKDDKWFLNSMFFNDNMKELFGD